MAPKHDYYETLGLDRKASADDVRKSYRKLARKYHPDLNPGDKSAEERFKNVQEAYDILSDPKKRQMYDQYGFYSENGFPGAGGPFPGGTGQRAQPNMDFSGFEFSDYSDFGGNAGGGSKRRAQETGGGFRDIFSQFFGGPKPVPTSNTPWISTSGRPFAAPRPASLLPAMKSAKPAMVPAPAARAKSPAHSVRVPAM
jgi:molecular chaperone DnaJ